MNGKICFMLVLTIICILFHIILFTMPVDHTEVFWICYAFVLLSFSGQFLFIQFRLKRRQLFMIYSLTIIGGFWLLSQILLTFYFVFYPLDYWIVLSICSLLTGAILVLFLCITIIHKNSESVEVNITKKRKMDHRPLSDLSDDDNI